MDLHTRAQSLTKLEAERELVRLWELEESLKPKPMSEAPLDEKNVDLWIEAKPEQGKEGNRNIFRITNAWYCPDAKTWFVTDGYLDEPFDIIAAGYKLLGWTPIPEFNLEGEK